jgi:hypothetical protein
MIESIMYTGIGFLVAGLIGVAVVPLVHDRAVRLTKRRLEAAIPQEVEEIQAYKDLLRVESAMATRRFEMMIEQLRNKNSSQLVELGKKSDVINRLTLELNTVKAAAAKVVAAYSSRKPIVPTVRQSAPANTRRRDGDVTRLLSVLARRRSSERISSVGEPTRRAG